MTPWRYFLIAFVVGLTWGLFGAYAFAPPPATPLEGARVALVAALPFGAGRVAPDACVDRLLGLGDLGIDRFVITGASFGADREHARMAEQLLTGEVVPALRRGGVR